MSQFHYQKDDNNVVAVTMDMEGPVNLMNESFAPLLAETVAKLEAEEQLAGVILGSAKKTFFAGGDLRQLSSIEAGSEQEFQDLEHVIFQHSNHVVPSTVQGRCDGDMIGLFRDLLLNRGIKIKEDPVKDLYRS